MSTWVSVARLHLVHWTSGLVGMWANMAFVFALEWVIIAGVRAHTTHPPTHGYFVGGAGVLFVYFLIFGLVSTGRGLPFALALGVTRRAYYTGAAVFAAGLAVANGALFALFAVVERTTGGWGVGMHFFRVPWILDGPWYLTGMTSFVLLALLFLYGMWFGIVYRRWGAAAVIAFAVAQVTVLLSAVLAVTWFHAWPAVGRFFTGLTVEGLVGVLAGVALLLLVGGYGTIRRATV